MNYSKSATSFGWWTLLRLLALLSSSAAVHAQDLVPGAYTPAPTGFNVVNIAAVFSDGALAFDPSLPVEEASATIGVAAFGIGRTLNIAGRFANIGVGIPFVVGSRRRAGARPVPGGGPRRGSAIWRFASAVNLYGAPAMTRQQFATYRATTIVGVSLVVGAPVGQYDSDPVHQSRHEPLVVQAGARVSAHEGPMDVRRGPRRGCFSLTTRTT